MAYVGSNITGCNSPAIGADKTTFGGVFDTTMQALDLHDHSSGKGTQIPTAGIADSAVTTAKVADLAITAGKLAAAVGVVPTGVQLDYGGSSAPTGYLMCDGSAVSRVTYAALFAVIGITFGAGDGVSTFNVPAPQGRTVIGAGAGSGLTSRTLGATGGEETHTLTIAEMPSHDHNYSHAVAGDDHDNSGAGLTDYTFNTIATSATGGDGAHNNMQPWIAMNRIIKT